MAASIFCALRNVSIRNVHCSLLTSFYHSVEHLSKYSYWKKRYQQQGEDLGFDWFLGSEDVLDFLISNIEECSTGRHTPLSYLDLGCGTSKLAGHILTHSPMPVSMVLLDYVSEALQYQKDYVSTCPALAKGSSSQLVCADVMCLPFGDSSFNMAVDKGTMDALMKHSTRGQSTAEVMMSEVKRVMTPGGRFLQISDEDPDTRLAWLEELDHTSCSANDSDGVMAGAVGPAEALKSIARCNTAASQLREAPLRKQMSSWFFKVIPSRWSKEYFIFWSDKL